MYEAGQAVEALCRIGTGSKRLGNYIEHYEWIRMTVIGKRRSGKYACRCVDSGSVGFFTIENLRRLL